MPRILFATALVVSSAFGAVACSSSAQRGPEVASASDQTSYAEAWPDHVDGLVKQLNDQETEARAIVASWEKLPAETGNTKDIDTRALFEKAESAGKSRGYVSERRGMNGVRAFYNDEKDEISRRVAGTVEYAAKEKGCENKELGGSAAYGVKEAIDKRIEHRLRASNEGQTLLEEERYKVDKTVADKLEKQLDDVASASYLVHVGIVDARAELKDRYGEASRVRGTLDDAIKSDNEKLADPRRAEASKKVIKARVTELTKQRAALDGVIDKARQNLEQAEARAKEIEKEYDDKWRALRDRLVVPKS